MSIIILIQRSFHKHFINRNFFLNTPPFLSNFVEIMLLTTNNLLLYFYIYSILLYYTVRRCRTCLSKVYPVATFVSAVAIELLCQLFLMVYYFYLGVIFRRDLEHNGNNRMIIVYVLRKEQIKLLICLKMERLCNFASHSIYVWEDLLRDIQYFDDLALSAFVLNTDVGWSNDINILFFNNQFISISESVGVTSQKKIWYISDPRIWKSAVIYDGEASIYLSFHWVWALTHILRLRKVINIRERPIPMRTFNRLIS